MSHNIYSIIPLTVQHKKIVSYILKYAAPCIYKLPHTFQADSPTLYSVSQDHQTHDWWLSLVRRCRCAQRFSLPWDHCRESPSATGRTSKHYRDIKLIMFNCK